MLEVRQPNVSGIDFWLMSSIPGIDYGGFPLPNPGSEVSVACMSP